MLAQQMEQLPFQVYQWYQTSPCQMFPLVPLQAVNTAMPHSRHQLHHSPLLCAADIFVRFLHSIDKKKTKLVGSLLKRIPASSQLLVSTIPLAP